MFLSPKNNIKNFLYYGYSLKECLYYENHNN